MRPLIALVFAMVLVAGVLPAGAQNLRLIPADAKRGEFTAQELPVVEIDGKTLRLAPGARILNERNMTITPNLVAPKSRVAYQLDAQGLVRVVWILTTAEAKAK